MLAARGTAALDALTAAFEAGAVVIAEGEAACAVGAWGLCGDGSLRAVWGWLPEAVIRPSFDDGAATALRDATSQARMSGVGHHPAALALGPEGSPDFSASSKQVTVV
jgi:hypothetical protein